MPSLFDLVFGCCLRQQPLAEQVTIDETTGLLPPTIDPPIAVYTDVEPPDQSYIKERMENIVRAKQSKMVDVLSATPYYLNDSGLQTSRSNGSTSRTRERPIRTGSRSPPPSSGRSDSSTSLLRNNSNNAQVPQTTSNPNLRSIRIIKGGLHGLERGRSQTLKRRTIDPEADVDPSELGQEQHSNDSEHPAANGIVAEPSSTSTTPPTDSQESISAAAPRPASPEETPKQKEYHFEGVSELTGGWGASPSRGDSPS